VRVAFTGHRPDKLGGYKTPNPIYDRVVDELHKALVSVRPTLAISGMALGVDQWAAEIALDLDIPLLAAIPFQGQESTWPDPSKAKYRALLARASHVIEVSKPGFAAWKMQKRNEWMVDNCDLLIAVWNWSPGGTCNCIKYAQKVGRQAIYIKPED
jgi:uncharacterized phage-like protein YoqJ